MTNYLQFMLFFLAGMISSKMIMAPWYSQLLVSCIILTCIYKAWTSRKTLSHCFKNFSFYLTVYMAFRKTPYRNPFAQLEDGIISTNVVLYVTLRYIEPRFNGSPCYIKSKPNTYRPLLQIILQNFWLLGGGVAAQRACNAEWKYNSPGPLFTKKTPSYGYRDPHDKPQTVWRPSQVYNGNPYTDKTASS